MPKNYSDKNLKLDLIMYLLIKTIILISGFLQSGLHFVTSCYILNYIFRILLEKVLSG